MEFGVEPVEKRIALSLLYDFYGDLLKESQRQIFEDYVSNDLSLAEIAEEHGVSRQGIHDVVKRCSRQMEEYEEKLHLIQRFRETGKAASEIIRLTEAGRDADQALKEIRGLSERILKLL